MSVIALTEDQATKFEDELSALVKRFQDSTTPASEKETKFYSFYNMYGRKEKKVASLKAWMKLKDTDIEKIFSTLPDFMKMNPDLKYRPMALTYLNQRRWEDEIEVSRKPALVPVWAQPNDYK